MLNTHFMQLPIESESAKKLPDIKVIFGLVLKELSKVVQNLKLIFRSIIAQSKPQLFQTNQNSLINYMV